MPLPRAMIACLALAALTACANRVPEPEREEAVPAAVAVQAPVTQQAAAGAPGLRVVKSVYGEGGTRFYIFEPAGPAATQPAPVVIFLHGWFMTSPASYGGWIEHLAHRGNIVIYPVYQEGWFDDRTKYLANALASVNAALALLAQPGHVQPDLTRVAVVGHSCGGLLAADYAAVADQHTLPVPRAVFAVEPGKSSFFEVARWKDIPPSTLLLTFAGDADPIVGDKDAQRILKETMQVPPGRKAMLRLRSDWHGYPPLIADHIVPICYDRDYSLPIVRREMGVADPDEARWVVHVPWHLPANAVDRQALWAPFDRLCDAAFGGAASIDGVVADRGLGAWDDGKPIKPMALIRP